MFRNKIFKTVCMAVMMLAVSSVCDAAQLNIVYEKELKYSNYRYYVNDMGGVGSNVEQQFVTKIFRRVKGATVPNSVYDYTIVATNSPSDQAISGPGGNIFVARGLVHWAVSSELAFVIGHEIGHQENQHYLKELSKKVENRIGREVDENTPVDRRVLSVARAEVGQIVNRYNEREADEFGFNALVQAKYNPLGGAVFFSRYERKYRTSRRETTNVNAYDTPYQRLQRQLELFEEYTDGRITTDGHKVYVDGNYVGGAEEAYARGVSRGNYNNYEACLYLMGEWANKIIKNSR